MQDNTFILDAKINLEKRPEKGYAYIYIYSRDDLFLYVGQTIQPILQRYHQHLNDNSGAHYANQIHCFQIDERYANYAEGYLARRLQGISQWNVPSVENNEWVPEEVKAYFRSMGTKFSQYKGRSGYLRTDRYPISTFAMEGDGEYEHLLRFHAIVESNLIWKNFVKKNETDYGTDIYMLPLIYDQNGRKIDCQLFFKHSGEYRPIMFFVCTSAGDIKEIAKLRSNFPIYCLLEVVYYNRYSANIERISKCAGAGIAVVEGDHMRIVKRYLRPYGRKNIKCKDIMHFIVKTPYKARKTPYGYYQVA